MAFTRDAPQAFASRYFFSHAIATADAIDFAPADNFSQGIRIMELIVGSFLLVAVTVIGHIGLVIAIYLRRSNSGIAA
jgi:hypothetical protein